MNFTDDGRALCVITRGVLHAMARGHCRDCGKAEAQAFALAREWLSRK